MQYQQKNVILIDNFYENPNEVREAALALPFRKDVHGYHFWRTRPQMNFCGPPEETIIPTLESHIGASVARDQYWNPKNDEAYEWMNMSFYKVIHNEEDGHARANHIHHDISHWSGIIYLSPDLPPSVGTQLWRHKPSGDEFAFGDDSWTGDVYTGNLYDDRGEEPQENWEKTDFISYKYNRLVLFRGTMFHSSAHTDEMPDGERLNQFLYFNQVI